jgi:integrase
MPPLCSAFHALRLYKLLEDRKVELLRISKRSIRVRKSDLSKLYQNTPEKPTFITKSVAEINKIVEEYISMQDALQQFNISQTWFYNKIRNKKITPIIIKDKAHYPIQPLLKKFVKKEYAEEVYSLYNTPCREPVLKAASLFSCLTGLRFSDILALKWENLETYPDDGGHCIRLRTEKTDAEVINPISQEAYDLCGEKSTGLVFKGFKKTMLQHILPKWLQAAGITKHITFHCFRHTFATLLVSSGSEIYTVSKMLTHKNVSTTQIYADLIDEKKRQAADTIKLTISNNK